MLRHNCFGALPGYKVFYRLHFSLSIRDKMVDCDNHRHAKALQVFDVASQVRATGFHRVHILNTKIRLRNSTVHFHRANRRHQHHSRRREPGFAALNIEEFLCAQVSTKSGLRHHVITKLQSGCCGDHRITAVGNIGKWTAMNKGRVIFQSLYQVGLHRIFQQDGHLL